MPGQDWTKNEIDALTQAVEKTGHVRALEIPGRTGNAVRNKAARLGLIGDGVSRKQWPQADIDRLAKLIEQGLSLREITTQGLLSGYTLNSLRKKAGRLGLVDQRRSERVKQAIRFNTHGLWYFRRFLQEHWQTCTPEQIARLWNEQSGLKVSRRRVIYHLKRLGLKQPWSVVIRMPYSVAKRKSRSEKAEKSQQRRWRRYRAEMEQHLKELALKLRRKSRSGKKRVAERVCRFCKRRWPAAQPFFHVTRKQTRDGEREYLLRRCRLCENKRRRRATKEQ